MQRSSETIAALATALAKAQMELTNPEKSLTGTLESHGGVTRSFRYAPLSSGLEIVRKTLGQHELAVIQATAVDPSSGFVNLTTTLAHKSGEWISSDWPVCRTADTASPRRMGAALTYARRYALFTLVGIAGEDDLDAPDLNASPQPTPASVSPRPAPVDLAAKRNGRGPALRPTLTAQDSAALRDRLLGEVPKLVSTTDAAAWARRAIAEKNTLAAPDALRVEEAFRARLAELKGQGMPSLTPQPDRPDHGGAGSADQSSVGEADGQQPTPKGIDKSVLTISEPKRRRSKEHLKFVRTRPCLICERSPADAHHIRYAQPRALGRKVSDEFTVPLCRTHHRQVHGVGDEFAWWKSKQIDPMEKANDLWAGSQQGQSV
jgi:hypothetical protein